MLRNWSLNPLAKVAIGILRKYGADAHVYLPGIGTVSGLTAGNYLDSAGVTAATVDNPVGLSLDALQAMTLGAQSVVDPSFDDASKWTPGAGWSVSGGAAVATAAGSGANIQPSGAGYLATVNGSPYVAEVVIGSVTSGSCQLIIWNGSTNVAASAFFSAPGTYQVRYIANNTQCRPYLAAQSANTTLSASSISNVPEPGIHATQATTANKPILRRGTLNLLTSSQDFSNAAWIKTNVTLGSGISDPDGSTTAFSITATASSANILQLKIDVGVSVVGVNSFWVKRLVGTGQVLIYKPDANGTDITAAIAGGSWVRVTSAATVPNGNTNSYSGIVLVASGDSVAIWHPQREVGTTVSDYSPTTTSAASNPSAGKYSWQFDGVNDSLSLGAPLFQLADDHAVIVGANCTASANNPIFVALSANTGDYKGSALIYVNSAGKPTAYWNDGTNVPSVTGPTSLIGTNFVASARAVGNVRQLKVNGALSGSVTTTMLATTTNAASLGIDPRTGSTGWFQGSIYPVIAIKGTLSDSDLLVLERFVGQLSGVQI